MVEFFGEKITEQELEQAYQLAIEGMGSCQVLIECASEVSDRMFAVAAHEAYLTIARACIDLLS